MEFVNVNFNEVFADKRGFFAPLPLKYEEGQLNKNWIQSNISFNPQKYTLRGLHFQVGDKAQAKLVKVIIGEIVDFVLDIRPDSPEYMKLKMFVLKPGDELLVPRGYAHGFLTTEFNSVVQYLVDNVYSPESEGSIYWKEIKELSEYMENIESEILISDKDLLTKNFDLKNQ